MSYIPMQTDVVDPIALQGPPPSSSQQQQYSNTGGANSGSSGGGDSFCAFDDMDFMAPSDYTSGLPFDDQQINSMFNRSLPMNCMMSSPFVEPKAEYDDITQFLNPNPTEITSI